MALSVPYQAPDEKIFGRLASELLAELPERLSTRVLENAKRLADHPALVDGNVRWSYAELGQEIHANTSKSEADAFRRRPTTNLWIK